MRNYVIRRLAGGVVVLLLLSFLTFMMVNAAPGSTLIAIFAEGPGGGVPTAAQIERFEAEFGLDKPVLERYGTWLANLVQGDMGRSIANQRPVWGQIQDALPVSIELMILSMTFAIAFAIPIGLYSAIRRSTLPDYVARFGAVLGLAVPNFWLGILVLVAFAAWANISLSTLDPPYIWNGVISNLQGYIAPAMVLGASLMATTMRMTRSSVLEVLHEDYVRTAWAKGLSERTVVLRHVFRNAMLPVVTIVGAQIAFLIGGSVVIESIFRLDGLGNFALTSVSSRDLTSLMGITVFLGSIIVLANLLVDLSYTVLDPRIRLQ